MPQKPPSAGKAPSWSVIVPAFREDTPSATWLARLSLWSKVREVVVAECACTMSFQNILREQPKVRLFQVDRHGRGFQLNAAARAARGPYFLFLHADTLLTPHALDSAERVLNEGKAAGGAFSLGILNPSWVYRWKAWWANRRAKTFIGPFGDQAFFARRDVFEKIGGFPDWPLFEDVEFWRRLQRFGEARILEDRVWTSSRRWEKQGYFSATLKSWWLLLLYFLGVSPHKLAPLYSGKKP